ncbi:MAG: hypothetical protein AAB385_11770, partial [Planctomycetota bacterium]
LYSNSRGGRCLTIIDTEGSASRTMAAKTCPPILHHQFSRFSRSKRPVSVSSVGSVVVGLP